MKTLRNNLHVSDPRLDRIEFFDERSRAYPVSAALTAAAPRKSRMWQCKANLDQGMEGACVGFGWAHELAAEPSPASWVDARFAREQIYWAAQKLDPWPGGSYPGASPLMEGSSVLAGAQVCQRLGFILEYRWAFGLDDVLDALAQLGPVVIGVRWMSGMSETNQHGFITASGRVTGGHCCILRGVNFSGGFVTLRNSWGWAWGSNGDALLSFEDLDLLLRSAGEACVPMRRAAPIRRTPEPKAPLSIFQRLFGRRPAPPQIAIGAPVLTT